MGDQVTMRELPECDFCDDRTPARYDSRLRDRTAWAYLCETHWRRLGIGRLGTGFGQRLVLESEVSTEERKGQKP